VELNKAITFFNKTNMFSKRIFWCCVAISFVAQLMMAQTQIATTSGAELVPVKYKEIPLGTIRPKGWLRNQMDDHA
jgi:hypothetical protein